MPSRPPRFLIVLASAGLIATGLVGSAGAAVSCTYSSATKRVDVSLNANNDVAYLYRNGSAIRMNAANCGAATVRNTNLIVVTGAADSQRLEVMLSGGPFAPGFSRVGETRGSTAEIEFQIDLGAGTDHLRVEGGTGPDRIRFGSAGVNLNEDDDRDITTLTGVNDFTGSGEEGNDRVIATGGKGTGGITSYDIDFFGHEGADTLTGGNGSNFMYGGSGPDKVSGGAGAENVSGDGGNDVLKGGSGDDNLFPGPGDDKVFAGSGSDDMYQELTTTEGDDIFSGGPGIDEYDTFPRTATQKIDLDGVADDGLVGERDNVKPDVEEVEGGSGKDTITGTNAANLLEGNAGNDILRGLGGDDSLIASTGTDTVLGGAGEDEMDGGSEADTLHGGPDNDFLEGGSGGDVVNGDGDDDQLDEDAAVNGADKLHGGSGNDEVSYSARTQALYVSIGYGGANDGQTSAEFDEVFADVEEVTGGSLGDVLAASQTAQTNQTLRGLGGVDTLYGGDGRDLLLGGTGADNLYPEEGQDRISGDDDGDTIYANDGSYDYVDGGPGTDTCNLDAFDTPSYNCP